MRRIQAALAVGLIAVVALSGPVLGARSIDRNSDASTGPTQNRAYALVQLKGAPLATSAKTKPAAGKKINLRSDATKAYRAQLAAMRNQYKTWLRANAPNARVTSEFDISLNAVGVKLNGHTLAQVRRSDQVLAAQYQGLYHPLGHEDPDLTLIDAMEAWTLGGGAATAGEGVKVAIVDTGIDVTHPCFSDAGYPDVPEIGDTRFTNDKVIAAKVFYNKASNLRLTPEAIQSHGTHVAGTVACNLHTPAVVDGVDIPYDPSGVAPRALLGNYNVFPGQVGNARSEDIVNALEAAYADGFDVANMSLGGGSQGLNDLLAKATDNLDKANMVIAVAAGNSGPGHYTIESPGKAARALTAAASTVGHFVGAPVRAAGQSHGAASGDFETVTSDLTAPLAIVADATNTVNGLSTACTALPAGSLTGKIALISRGVCTFSTKIRNAQNAGAVAVLVVNNVAGDPTAMASDGTPNQPTVPAYMLGLTAGLALKALPNGTPTTIDSTLEYFNTDNDNIMAGFSSQGPTDVDFRVKPDVTAPGVNVLSAISKNDETCETAPCWAFYQGTSMATPHLAGAAAVVIDQHPGWAAWQVRSAVVNTAVRDVLYDSTTGKTIVTDPQIQGAGLLNVANAVSADVALDPVSVSFGAVPSGSGQSKSFPVRLTNISGATLTNVTLSVTAATGTGVSYTVSPTSIGSLANGASATVTVTMRSVKGNSKGDHAAWLNINDNGTTIAHAAVFTLSK